MEDVQRKARELASATCRGPKRCGAEAAGQLLEEGRVLGMSSDARELAGDMSDAFFKVVSNAKNLMPLPLPPPPPPPPPPLSCSLSAVWATLLVILLTVIILRLRKQRAEILRLQKALVLKEKEIGRVFVDKERELTRVYADSERELNRVHVLKEKEIVAAIEQAAAAAPESPGSQTRARARRDVSRSVNHPGCLWLTLQFSNTLVLLDAATMGVRQVIKCPQLLERDDGTLLRIGGPHALVECGRTGDIWVALKGSVPCHPGVTGSSKASLASAITRVCCDPARSRSAWRRSRSTRRARRSRARPWRPTSLASSRRALQSGGSLLTSTIQG